MGLLTRRPIMLWLGVPALLALGIAGGLLAASLASGGSPPPAMTTAHHQGGGHVMPDGMEMAGAAHGVDHEASDQSGDPQSSWSRPAVLGAFGAVNAGVVITAFLLRRTRPSSDPRIQRGS